MMSNTNPQKTTTTNKQAKTQQRRTIQHTPQKAENGPTKKTKKNPTTNKQTNKKHNNKETREVQKLVIIQLGFYFKFGYTNYTQSK